MITYLLKTVWCSGLFLVAYHLLLEREKMLRFNRFFLLFSLLLAFLIPVIHLSVSSEIIVQPQVPVLLPDAGMFPNEEMKVAPVTAAAPAGKAAFNGWYAALSLYIAGCLVLLYRFGKNLFHIILVVRRNDRVKYKNTFLVLVPQPTVPHSFFHFIFLDKEAYESGLIQPEVLCHERTHVQQKHSIDILLIELLLIFCWFNPVLYFYRKAIRLNHEFLADAAVMEKFADAPAYQQLLLQTATIPVQHFPVSSFNYSITKKRFLMMTKQTSTDVATLKSISLLPLAAAAILLFSTRVVAQIQTEEKKKDTSTAREKSMPLKTNQKDGEVLGTTPWVRMSIGHTEEGAPPEQLQEYKDIISKYEAAGKWWQTFSNRVSETDRNRMEMIFKQMSFAQQGEQFAIFIKAPAPPPKAAPTKAQFEAFKNSKIYGLWINDKQVSNSALNGYSNTDFAQFYISKLYGSAKVGRSYTHQLNMMTNEYYQTYLDKVAGSRKTHIGFAFNNHPVDSIRQRYRSNSVSRFTTTKLQDSLYRNVSLFSTIPLGEGVAKVEMEQYQYLLKRALSSTDARTFRLSDQSEFFVSRLASTYWRMDANQRKQVIKETTFLISSLPKS